MRRYRSGTEGSGPARVLVCLMASSFLLAPRVRAEADETDEPSMSAASIEADRTKVKLGEPVLLTIRIQGREGRAAYRLTDPPDLGPFVELSRDNRSEEIAGRTVQEILLTVASFEELGRLKLPAIRLIPAADGSVGGELTVPAVEIEVISVLDGVDEPQPRDVAGPVAVLVPDYRSLVLAGLLGLWLLLGLVIRRRREPVEVPARLQELPSPRLAHEIAAQKLRRIVDDDLLHQGKFHSYFTRISETVREYLGNRYAFFAMDLTTRELLHQMRDRVAPGLELGVLEQLLREADLVKFARLKPTDATCSNAINRAYGLVEATRVVEDVQRRVQAVARRSGGYGPRRQA